MSRVTSKLQVTIPQAIAREYGIEPGSDIEFEPAGEVIRVRIEEQNPEKASDEDEMAFRLRLFDDATRRQKVRNRAISGKIPGAVSGRGWRREDLYDRASSR